MLNQAPYEWTIRQLIEHCRSGPSCQVKGGDWEPARPYGLYSISNRLRLALMVFTGKADALRWPFQNPKAY
jgi:hypothetical protein